jgi:hypothetical protein
MGVLARRLVGEYAIHLDGFQLPFRVLVKATDPNITNTLTGQAASKSAMCQDEIYYPWQRMSINVKSNPILTYLSTSP